jgi:hypothetical protein
VNVGDLVRSYGVDDTGVVLETCIDMFHPSDDDPEFAGEMEWGVSIMWSTGEVHLLYQDDVEVISD